MSRGWRGVESVGFKNEIVDVPSRVEEEINAVPMVCDAHGHLMGALPI